MPRRPFGADTRNKALLYSMVLLFFGLWMLFWAPAGFARVVTDDTGRVVTIPDRPQRIVSMAPGITEILFALGLEDRIAGVTSFCDWPPRAAQKTTIGGFTNPSLEIIVSLRPDLIVATADGNRPETVRQLEKIGFPVFVTNPSNVEGILKTVMRLGDMTQTKEAASNLTQSLQTRLDRVSAHVGGKTPPRVFFQIGMDPVISAGSGTLIDDVIRLAGGVNIAQGRAARYPRFSAEGVMAGSPDVLLFAPMATDREFTKIRAYWEQFPGIPAVKTGRIHPVNTDLIGRASLRIVDAVEQTARFLHPDLQ